MKRRPHPSEWLPPGTPILLDEAVQPTRSPESPARELTRELFAMARRCEAIGRRAIKQSDYTTAQLALLVAHWIEEHRNDGIPF